jgi:hypothetical protein
MERTVVLPDSIRARQPSWRVEPRSEWHGRACEELAQGVIRFPGEKTYHLINPAFLANPS